MRPVHILLFSLLTLLAGCSSSTPRYSMLGTGGDDPVPSKPVVKPPEPPPPVFKPAPPVQTNPVVHVPLVNVPTNPPPIAAPIGPAPNSEGWVALGAWCRTTGRAKLTQVTWDKQQLHYQLESPGGRIELVIGSQVARWNGMNFMVSYPLHLVDHHPCINYLDLEKSIIPLLTPLPGLVFTNKVIVIDPGHGGEQVGTRSVLGPHFEKEYTLDWGLRLQKLLVNEGWKVIMTRTNDVDISVTNRVTLAEHSGAALYISLHFNSAGSEQSGLETYCVTPVGLPSNLTRDYPDDPTRFTLNNAYDYGNFCLALRLHHALLQQTHANDRSVRRARFMTVLRGQSRPAVLIEGGYLSNRKEAGLIATADYRQKLAQAIADVLK